MPRVTRRPLAAADIIDIWDHIAEDSLDQADRWVNKLDEKFRLIATQPLMGRAREWGQVLHFASEMQDLTPKP